MLLERFVEVEVVSVRSLTSALPTTELKEDALDKFILFPILLMVLYTFVVKTLRLTGYVVAGVTATFHSTAPISTWPFGVLRPTMFSSTIDPSGEAKRDEFHFPDNTVPVEEETTVFAKTVAKGLEPPVSKSSRRAVGFEPLPFFLTRTRNS